MGIAPNRLIAIRLSQVEWSQVESTNEPNPAGFCMVRDGSTPAVRSRGVALGRGSRVGNARVLAFFGFLRAIFSSKLMT